MRRINLKHLVLFATFVFSSIAMIASAGDDLHEKRDVDVELPDNGEHEWEWSEELEGKVERIAKKVETNAEEWSEEFGEALEEWAEKLGESWEAWGEEHEVEWEAWGAKLENRLEKLSEEDGKAAAHKLRMLAEENMDLLRDMPVEPLIEQIADSIAELKDFPWEELTSKKEEIGEVVGEMKDVIEQAIHEAAAAREKANRSRQNLRGKNVEPEQLRRNRREIQRRLHIEMENLQREKERLPENRRSEGRDSALQLEMKVRTLEKNVEEQKVMLRRIIGQLEQLGEKIDDLNR